MKTILAVGVSVVLWGGPVAAWAQEQAPSPVGADPGLRRDPGQDPLEHELERLRAAIARVEAESDAVVLHRAHDQAEPARAGHRTFGIGTAVGGGVFGMSLLPSQYQPGGRTTASGAVGRLPSIEARFFTSGGMSVDVSVPLGDMLSRLAQGLGFMFDADAFLNFNVVVTPGVHLMVGPGVGFSAGQFATSTTSGGYGPVTYPGGAARLEMQAGAEFVTADGHLGIGLMARPHVGFLFYDASTLYGPYSGAGPQTIALFNGGVMGLVSVNVYATRD